MCRARAQIASCAEPIAVWRDLTRTGLMHRMHRMLRSHAELLSTQNFNITKRKKSSESIQPWTAITTT